MLASAVKGFVVGVTRQAAVTTRYVAPSAAAFFSVATEGAAQRTKLKIPTKRAAALLQELEKEAVEKSIVTKAIDDFKPGDSVEVQYLLNRTANKVQRVRGVVLARRNRGTGSSFSIRNHIGGYGYEQKIFLHSPLLQSVKLLDEAFIHKGKKRVRRAKLFYLRDKPPSLTTV